MLDGNNWYLFTVALIAQIRQLPGNLSGTIKTPDEQEVADMIADTLKCDWANFLATKKIKGLSPWQLKTIADQNANPFQRITRIMQK